MERRGVRLAGLRYGRPPVPSQAGRAGPVYPSTSLRLGTSSPWYLGTGGRIRAAKRADIDQGLVHLQQLLDSSIFKNLRVIVLAGRKAQRARSFIERRYASISILEMFHPSPQSLNRVPNRREQILQVLHQVRNECQVSQHA
jgi:hypothetical protein